MTTATKLATIAEQLKATSDKEERKLLARQAVDLMAADLAPEAKEIVNDIESDLFPATRNNYGRYMDILSEVEGVYRLALVCALTMAGAGPGLESALEVM